MKTAREGAMFQATTLTMPAECDLRSVQALRSEILAALDGGLGLTLDCGGVQRVDMAFVQLLLSTRRSAARRGVTVALTNRTASLDAASRRAGLEPSNLTAPLH
jgi:phospholipid transport system transporter-binding protein